MEDSVHVLIVDDDKAIANFLSKMLIKSEDNDYDVAITHTAEDGLHLIEESKFDIVILDVNLPGKSGIEFLKEIKEIDPDIEVIIMTGNAKIETAIEALREGAYDYLQKPFTQEQVITTLRNAYQKRRLTMEKRELINNLSDVNDQLEKANEMLAEKKALVDRELEKKVEDLTNINLFVKGITPQLDLIKLMNIIPRFLIDLFGFNETEDPSLREHAERVSNIATKIAKQLNLEDSMITNIRYAALIHDIGRVGSIKTSPKDGVREKIMKIHQNTEKIIKPVSFLSQGLEYIHYMFENFDGSGFPEGKTGDDIPIGARILAIANAYDEIYTQLKGKNKKEPSKDAILAELSSYLF